MFRSSSLPRRALAYIPPTVVVGALLLPAASGVTAQESATPTAMGLVQEAGTFPTAPPPRSGHCPRGHIPITPFADLPVTGVSTPVP